MTTDTYNASELHISEWSVTKGRLQVLNIQKYYGKRHVVKDVSLSMSTGEVVGLLGPNGAGKTTTFYIIVGLLRASHGGIFIDGRAIHQLPIHQRAKLGLGYLPQEMSIFRNLSVQENIRAVLELQKNKNNTKLTKLEIEGQLHSLLHDLRIEHLIDMSALALSGGERRRVEIARALATRPRFILLDEPFAGVDPIAVIEIKRIISFLKNRGIGVLITDHNVRETLDICDHSVIMSDGRVLAQGTSSELIENHEVRRVYLGENFKL
jgi:lipopolysaccharide export system ATP-binding protein